jgi:hypothetical protein
MISGSTVPRFTVYRTTTFPFSDVFEHGHGLSCSTTVSDSGANHGIEAAQAGAGEVPFGR